jgi:type I restriction enzyme S subunit
LTTCISPWTKCTLNDLGTFSKGSGVTKAEVKDSGLPCIRYGEIYTHHKTVISLYNSYIDRTTAQSSKRIEYGDILLAGSGETKEEIGKATAFMFKEEAYAGGDIVIFKPKDSDSRFLAYLLNSQSVVSQKTSAGKGDAVVHISAKDLGKIEVTIPPISEQRVITKALTDIDELIEKTDQEESKLMQLFSTVSEKYLDSNHFSDSSHDLTLGGVGKVLRGVTFNAEADFRPFGSENSIQLLRSNNVQDNRLFLENTYNLSLDKVNTFQILKNGDSLICMANGSKDLVGKTAYIDDSVSGKYTYGSFMGSFRPDDPANGKYISYILKSHSFRNHINLILAGSSINNLTPALIEEFKFDMPNPGELKNIVEILSDIEMLIQETRNVKSKYECIKLGMAHDLLTGKVRLV